MTGENMKTMISDWAGIFLEWNFIDKEQEP